ncbi:MAG: hypothetical protein L0H53_13065 [Candidatus Nitrosocosmicus sp.]|nr:hypothetical protein [Candidatus Nitrosocosmicus sp.]
MSIYSENDNDNNIDNSDIHNFYNVTKVNASTYAIQYKDEMRVQRL